MLLGQQSNILTRGEAHPASGKLVPEASGEVSEVTKHRQSLCRVPRALSQRLLTLTLHTVVTTLVGRFLRPGMEEAANLKVVQALPPSGQTMCLCCQRGG